MNKEADQEDNKTLSSFFMSSALKCERKYSKKNLGKLMYRMKNVVLAVQMSNRRRGFSFVWWFWIRGVLKNEHIRNSVDDFESKIFRSGCLMSSCKGRLVCFSCHSYAEGWKLLLQPNCRTYSLPENEFFSLAVVLEWGIKGCAWPPHQTVMQQQSMCVCDGT